MRTILVEVVIAGAVLAIVAWASNCDGVTRAAVACLLADVHLPRRAAASCWGLVGGSNLA